MKRALGVLALGGLLTAATPAAFGGWAVVTLLEVPEYLEAGKPTTIAFKIRQHGQTLMFDRSPTVTMHAAGAGFVSRMFGRDRVHAETSSHGVYEATITPDEAGEVTLTIDTDLYGWKVRLLPMRVVDAEDPPPALSPFERGRQLFAAKGCVTCHEKIDDPGLAELQTVKVGPYLTGRTFPADWLAMKLENPAENRGAPVNGVVMPQLQLDVAEIEALVSFINGDHATAETGGQ
jgi:mono/diheme cytochrome c family protein